MKKKNNNKKSNGTNSRISKVTNKAKSSYKSNATTIKTVKSVKKYPITDIKKKGKIIITQEFKNQLDYLHKEVGSTEWSGILSYKLTEGDFQNPDKIVVVADTIIPMDVGSSTYTEYSMDDDDYADVKIVDMFTKGKKVGMIHTHHDMEAYFSGTDMEELHDNTPNHDYYVSLIVNFKPVKDWVCKIAFITEMKSSYNLPSKELVENKYESMVTIDLVPELEVAEVSDDFKDRIKELNKPATTYSYSYGNPSSSKNQLSIGYGQFGDYAFEDDGTVYDSATNSWVKDATKKTVAKNAYDILKACKLKDYEIKVAAKSAITRFIPTADKFCYIFEDVMSQCNASYELMSSDDRITVSESMAKEFISLIEDKSLSDTDSYGDIELFTDYLAEAHGELLLTADLITDIVTELYANYE